MIEGLRTVYLFRSGDFGPRGTVVCAAPATLAVATFGGGGHHGQAGVQSAFGGNAFYRDEATGACFIGVWGRRKAARFRRALRAEAEIVIVREPPPARLTWWSTTAKPTIPA